MKKILRIFSIGLCIALFLTACSSASSEPLQVITKYYQSIKDGNFSAAYKVASSQTTENLTEDEFALYQNLNTVCYQFKDFKIAENTEDKTQDLGGTKYDDIAAFDVTITNYDYYFQKENTSTGTIYVVKEDGNWKVYKTFNKVDIANNYVLVGDMYKNGKGKDQNYVEAVSYYNKALGFDSTSIYARYGLASAYFHMGRYDESLQVAQTLADDLNDLEKKSDVLNLMGTNYLAKNDKTKAKAAFEAALQLDPNNEYAKNNLATYCK